MNHSPPLDAFARLESLGYGGRLIPIVPPGVELEPGCALWKALRDGSDNRGKAPGELHNGRWTDIKWRRLASTPDLHRFWADMGAGSGIRTGETLLAIDADIYDETWASAFETALTAAVGELPKRVGQAPKAMYLLRIPEGVKPPRSFSFCEGAHVVQFRYAGLQFVASGVHPKTLGQYRWTTRLVAYDDLPVSTPEALEALVAKLETQLPSFRRAGSGSEGDRGSKDQSTLRGAVEEIRRAVAAIPNDERFADRNEWVKIGFALHAALPDDPDAGLEIFREFSERWTGGENADDFVDHTWESLKSKAYEVGAGWLYDQANAAVGSRQFGVTQWFEQPDLEPAANSDIKTLDTITADMLFDEPPPQRWHVAGWIPHGQTTIMSGDGGTGKTLAALQLAMAGTTGQDWLGLPVQPGPVLFLTAEDEPEELHRRIHAMHKQLGTTPAAFVHPLHLISLHGKDAVIATPDAKNPLLLRPTRLMQRLAATMARVRPVLLVLDPQADLFGGKENERIHARQFIGYLQRLAAEYDCAVLLLAHPSMSGMASGSGASGTTAWSNSVRSRLYLSRETSEAGVEPDPNIRILEVKKSNRAVIGSRLVLRYRHGTFGVSEAETADSSLAEAKIVFLRVLNMWAANSEWVTLAQNTKRYAPRAMVAGSEDAAEIGERKLTAAMNTLLEAGLIHQEPFGPPSRLSYRIVSSRPASSEVKKTEFW